ncbi:MAG: DUF1559 domain-containing protein [Pirellulaceae bacterium]
MDFSKPPSDEQITDPERAELWPTIRGHLWFLACVGIGLGLMVLLLWPMGGHHPVAYRRMASANNLKHIGLALHNYHDTYSTFPSAYIPDENGKPMHSWRVLILPFFDGRNSDTTSLHQAYDFDKPWDHPDNLKVAEQMPSVYASPHYPEHRKQGLTTYLAISSEGTVLGTTKPSTFREITDGTSQTLMVIELLNRPVAWTEPVDISPDTILAQYARLADTVQHGNQVLLADGSVRFIGKDQRRQDLEDGFYINDGRGFDP